MIDQVNFVESVIGLELPAVTVFRNSAPAGEIELDLQNIPGRPLAIVRLLLSDATGDAIVRDAALRTRVVETLRQAFDGPSDFPEAILDLRGGFEELTGSPA